MIYCGIDLGLRPKTAFAVLSCSSRECTLDSPVHLGLTDEQIEELIWKYRPAAVAIDAPLSASMEKKRPAEKTLREMLKNYSDIFHAESSIGSPFGLLMFPITYRGKYLLQRLQGITNVIETHPLADLCFLGNDSGQAADLHSRKNEGSKIHFEILKKYIQDLPPDLTDDQYDAVVAAFLAYAYFEPDAGIPTTELPKLYVTDAPFVVFQPKEISPIPQ